MLACEFNKYFMDAKLWGFIQKFNGLCDSEDDSNNKEKSLIAQEMHDTIYGMYQRSCQKYAYNHIAKSFHNRSKYFTSIFHPTLQPVVSDIFESVTCVDFIEIYNFFRTAIDSLDRNIKYVLVSRRKFRCSVSMFNMLMLLFLLDIGIRIDGIIIDFKNEQIIHNDNNQLLYRNISFDEVLVNEYILVKKTNDSKNSETTFGLQNSSSPILNIGNKTFLLFDDISYSGTQIYNDLIYLNSNNYNVIYILYGLSISSYHYLSNIYIDTTYKIFYNHLLYNPIFTMRYFYKYKYVDFISKDINEYTHNSHLVCLNNCFTYNLSKIKVFFMNTLDVLENAFINGKDVLAKFICFYTDVCSNRDRNFYMFVDTTTLFTSYKIPDQMSLNKIMYGEFTSSFLQNTTILTKNSELFIKDTFYIQNYLYPLFFPEMAQTYYQYKSGLKNFFTPWYKYK